MIHPIALNRKNALFVGHDKGGKAWWRIASLVKTCKINGVEPFANIKATLEAIAAGYPKNRIDDAAALELYDVKLKYTCYPAVVYKKEMQSYFAFDPSQDRHNVPVHAVQGEAALPVAPR